ncbi:TIR domain-containing protein [Nitrosomonas sp. Nm51]|uniref:toll/interleukin-1 receptor domain-containing protein n=1 Tax=Nitrosomonas sp. Nm51 TaxID=133720 RepID=UPI0008CB76C6|nr:toll/interleukin-1 receptor domain-containing protein [Nitrosomonas sp. Nm51]SEQ78859.1 TIR domain-containing protein [Nitrosomonas sp. Nm51]
MPTIPEGKIIPKTGIKKTRMGHEIHIFLSYRQKNPDDIKARDMLAALCTKHGFKLIYDENTLGEGENLTRFMNDLGSARCVLILLSPEYFKSAYTLYELIRIYENADLDRRFIFPLRATADMSAYVKTGAKNDCWLKSEAVRNELCSRLKENDESAVWECVLDAWDAIVGKNLDTVTPSLEQNGPEEVLEAKLATVRETIDKAIADEHELLCKRIQSELTFFLEEHNIPLKHLKHRLGLLPGTDIEELAEVLVEKQVSDAIGAITGVITNQEAQLKQDNRWYEALSDAEQICGWLLIGSVDPVWWFHHQLKMKHIGKTDIRNQLILEHHAYAEVIISRSILRNASFRLDKNKAVPSIDAEINLMVVFDASKDALGQQFLSDIYKDLCDKNKGPNDTDEMIVDEVYGRAYAIYKSKGRPVCYLLSRDILNQFEQQSWYAYARQKLTGYLQFVYCDIPPRDEALKTMPSSLEEQEGLIGQIGYLLSLRGR